MCGKLWLVLRHCITTKGEFCLRLELNSHPGMCPFLVAALCLAQAVQMSPTCLAVCKVATWHQTPMDL